MDEKAGKFPNVIVSIKSPDQFGKILGLIHDEYFELEKVSYAKAEKTVEIPYRRIFHGGPSRVIKNRWIYRVEEVDVLRNILRIMNVEALEISDEAHIGEYSFNTLSYDEAKKELLLTCCEACTIRLTVSGIQLESEELGYHGKAKITRGFCFNSNTSKVYYSE